MNNFQAPYEQKRPEMGEHEEAGVTTKTLTCERDSSLIIERLKPLWKWPGQCS